MTVQVDSQPVTDQNMWWNDMCCINNSISCLEKKTTFGTHKHTCYDNFIVGLLPPHHPSCISEVYPSGAYGSTFSRACFYTDKQHIDFLSDSWSNTPWSVHQWQRTVSPVHSTKPQSTRPNKQINFNIN